MYCACSSDLFDRYSWYDIQYVSGWVKEDGWKIEKEWDGEQIEDLRVVGQAGYGNHAGCSKFMQLNWLCWSCWSQCKGFRDWIMD